MLSLSKEQAIIALRELLEQQLAINMRIIALLNEVEVMKKDQKRLEEIINAGTL
jgi:hypothetical protein